MRDAEHPRSPHIPVSGALNLLIIIVVVALCPGAGNSQDCPRVDAHRPFNEMVQTVVSGDLVITCGRDSCLILDISDLTSISFLSSFEAGLTDSSVAIAVDHDGSLIVASFGSRGLLLVDTTDPVRPTILQRPHDEIFVRDLSLQNTLLYVCEYSEGLQVLDVSWPAYPFVISTLPFPGQARWLAIDGDLALVLDDDGVLWVVDISSAWNLEVMGAVEIDPYPRAIDAEDGVATVAYSGSLVVVDYSDPNLPTITATVGDVVFDDVQLEDGLAYAGDGEGITIFDLSSPTMPSELGFIETYYSANVEAVGDLVFGSIDGNRTGLEVYDASSPAAPTLLGSYRMPVEARGIEICQGIGYVTDFHAGLRIMDYTDPNAPVELGFFKPESANGSYESYYSNASWDGVVAISQFSNDALTMIDVSDPEHPVEIATIVDDYTENIWDMAYYSGRLYLKSQLDNIGGIVILDVEYPAYPLVLGFQPARTGYTDPAFSGSHMFVTMWNQDFDTQLAIFDISDPAVPSQVSGTTLCSDCWRGPVWVAGNLALVGTDVLTIVDISNLSAPQIRGSYFPPDVILGIRAAHGNAYLSTLNYGVVVLDITDPWYPFEIAAIETPDSAWDVEVVGHQLIVPVGESGLMTIDIGCVPIFWDDFESGGTWAWTATVN